MIFEYPAYKEKIKQNDLAQISISEETKMQKEKLEKIMNMMTNDVPIEDMVESVTWLESMAKVDEESARKLRFDGSDYEEDDGVTR